MLILRSIWKEKEKSKPDQSPAALRMAPVMEDVT